METIRDVFLVIGKVYLIISLIHGAIFLFASSTMATTEKIKGKKRQEIMKNRMSMWNGFIWPKFWIGILKDAKNKRNI